LTLPQGFLSAFFFPSAAGSLFACREARPAVNVLCSFPSAQAAAAFFSFFPSPQVTESFFPSMDAVRAPFSLPPFFLLGFPVRMTTGTGFFSGGGRAFFALPFDSRDRCPFGMQCLFLFFFLFFYLIWGLSLSFPPALSSTGCVDFSPFSPNMSEQVFLPFPPFLRSTLPRDLLLSGPLLFWGLRKGGQFSIVSGPPLPPLSFPPPRTASALSSGIVVPPQRRTPRTFFWRIALKMRPFSLLFLPPFPLTYRSRLLRCLSSLSFFPSFLSSIAHMARAFLKHRKIRLTPSSLFSPFSSSRASSKRVSPFSFPPSLCTSVQGS